MEQKSADLRVIGMTDQQEAFLGSKSRRFRINEFLTIEDRVQGDIYGKIVQVNTYNRYIPMNMGGELVDGAMLEAMKSLGFNIDEDTIYIGKIRLLKESNYPIETGSTARVPAFEEVRDYFMKGDLEQGLGLGVIRNTNDILPGAPAEYKDRLTLIEEGRCKAQEDLPYVYNLYSMHQYPHIGVFGGSGSGKSFGLRVLLEELMKQRIPTVVLDPHYEMDFSEASEAARNSYEDRFERFVIGRDCGVEFEELNSAELKNLLNAAARLTESMENTVDVLRVNKDSVNGFETRLTMLLVGFQLGSVEKINQAAEQDLEKKDYYQSVREIYNRYGTRTHEASVRGVLWRFERIKKTGIFQKNIEGIQNALEHSKLCVIQGSMQLIQIFSSYLSNTLYNLRREYRDSLQTTEIKPYFPPFVLVTDEAHNFAPQTKDGQREVPSKWILREIAQEGRKYGVFLVLATQRPSLLDSTIVAQLNTKLIFRTTRAMDIETIRQETDLSPEEAKRLPYLQTGDVFISESSIGRTIFVRIRAADTVSPHRENPFDELKAQREKRSEEDLDRILNLLPITNTDLVTVAKKLEKERGETFSVATLKEKLNALVESGKIIKISGSLVEKYDLPLE